MTTASIVLSDNLYEGLAALDDRSRLVTNGRSVGERLPQHPVLADYLYEMSRTSVIRDEWIHDVQTATGVDRLLKDVFPTVSVTDFDEVSDPEGARNALSQVDVSRGLLLLTFHGPFRFALVATFKALFANGFVVKNVGKDQRGAAMFEALRTLMDGRQVYVAPDGAFGEQLAQIDVLGAPLPVAIGGAFLAFESRCATAFFTARLSGDGFAPVIIAGPVREGSETFSDFQARFFAFYAKQIEDALTGPPLDVALGGRWVGPVRDVARSRSGLSKSS